MADLDKLALALPEVTKELDEGRPAYKVAGKTFCFHRSPRPDALDPETGERLDDVLVFWVEDLEIKDILVESGERLLHDAALERLLGGARPDPET